MSDSSSMDRSQLFVTSSKMDELVCGAQWCVPAQVRTSKFTTTYKSPCLGLSCFSAFFLSARKTWTNGKNLKSEVTNSSMNVFLPGLFCVGLVLTPVYFTAYLSFFFFFFFCLTAEKTKRSPPTIALPVKRKIKVVISSAAHVYC